MDSDPFIGIKPDLVNQKLLKDIEMKLNVDNDYVFSENPDNLVTVVGGFYTNFVEPNLFPIIVISLLLIYLTIKYIIKVDKEEKNKEYHTHTKQPVVDISRSFNEPETTYKIASQYIPDDYLITDFTEEKIEVQDGKYPDDMIAEHYTYQATDRNKLDEASKLIFG